MANLYGTNSYTTNYGLNANGAGFSFISLSPVFTTTVANVPYYLNNNKKNSSSGVGDLHINSYCTNCNTYFDTGNVFISAGDLSVSGSIIAGNVLIGSLDVTGNTILGQNSSNTLTINATTNTYAPFIANQTSTFNALVTFNQSSIFNQLATFNQTTIFNQVATFNADSVQNSTLTFKNGGHESILQCANSSDTLKISSGIRIDGEATFQSTILANGIVDCYSSLYFYNDTNVVQLYCDADSIDQLTLIGNLEVNGNLFVKNGTDQTVELQVDDENVLNINNTVNVLGDVVTDTGKIKGFTLSATAGVNDSYTGQTNPDPPPDWPGPAAEVDGWFKTDVMIGQEFNSSQQCGSYCAYITDLNIVKGYKPSSFPAFGGGTLQVSGGAIFYEQITGQGSGDAPWLTIECGQNTQTGGNANGLHIQNTGGNDVNCNIDDGIAIYCDTINCNAITAGVYNNLPPDVYISGATSVATNTAYTFNTALGFTTRFPKIQVIFSDLATPNLLTNADYLAGNYVWDITGDNSCYSMVWEDHNTLTLLTGAIVARGVDNTHNLITRTSGYFVLRCFY